MRLMRGLFSLLPHDIRTNERKGRTGISFVVNLITLRDEAFICEQGELFGVRFGRWSSGDGG